MCAERQGPDAEAVQPQAGVPSAASASALPLLKLHRLLFETAMLMTDVRECPPDREVPMARKLTRRAARQMAAARKSFRGGRPVQPKPCPRCGTPCASAVQAAAHCVGPADHRLPSGCNPDVSLSHRSVCCGRSALLVKGQNCCQGGLHSHGRVPHIALLRDVFLGMVIGIAVRQRPNIQNHAGVAGVDKRPIVVA